MTKRADYPRIGKMIAGAFLCALLTGCGYETDTFGLTQKQIEDRELFHPVPARQAWANPQGMTFVMQRGLLGGSEQRIGLPNNVAVPGDNLLILRTRLGHLAAARFRFEEFVTRIGGAPAPFTSVKPGALMTGEDSLGLYFWTEEAVGPNVTCVLALRRLTQAERGLPQGAGVMDVMLRNCIAGTAAEALVPVLDASIGYGAVAGNTGGGSTRMLSPLAAPGADLEWK